MLKRFIQNRLQTALEISPAVLLSGARQIGKSTLSLSLYENYLTFDDGDLKLQVKENPKGFLKYIDKPICLDEIQKAPNLLEYIKIDIDNNRVNGSFLLTGSANILDNKEVKDSLAGRIIELSLYPLSIKEKNQKKDDDLIQKLFNGDYRVKKYDYYDELLAHIVEGGYPEMLKLSTPMQRSLWFSSYISTYIERDARDMGEIRDLDSFIKFVNVIATRSGTILNISNLSSDVCIANKTTQNYLGILAKIYQGFLVKPYYENIGKQFIKSPKFFLGDTGLLCHFLKIKTTKELLDSQYKGAIFETFIFDELLKHMSFSQELTDIYHYRTSDKKEIDFILKNGKKTLAIEIKSSSSIKKSDFKHIIEFQEKSKEEVIGLVFYTGENTMELSDRLVAIPMSLFL